MTPAEVGGAVLGGLVVLGLSSAGAVSIFKSVRANGNGNGKSPTNGDTKLIVEVITRQSEILRDIRDGVIALRSDTRLQSLEQAHLQKSIDAVHSRLDAALMGRKP